MKPETKDTWQEFIEQCLQFKDKKELEMFLNTFLTVTEKTELLNRYRIIKELLRENKTQREIARDLKVSIANVTRGSNVLKISNKTIKNILKN